MVRSPAVELPRSIGRYVVEGPLGAGGMGTVLRGRDPELDRPVAIKLLHAHRSLDEGHRARLHREAQALAALAHPNIVNVFEVGIDGDDDGPRPMARPAVVSRAPGSPTPVA